MTVVSFCERISICWGLWPLVGIVLLNATATLRAGICVTASRSSRTAHILSHRYHLHSTNQRGLTLSQGEGTVTLFLLSPSELFPGATCLFFGDLQFALHFRYGTFCVLLFGSHALHVGFCSNSQVALSLECSFKGCLALLSLLLILTMLIKPPLELALRRGTKALKLDNSMEQISSSC